jgi:hypothetical protein
MQDEGAHARTTLDGVELVRMGMRQLSFIAYMYSRLQNYVKRVASAWVS